MKNRIKNSLLIGSEAFAELFFQTHHSPFLPLLSGANSIICLTMSDAYGHPLSFSFLFFSLSPCLFITPFSSCYYSQTVTPKPFCFSPRVFFPCISVSLPPHPAVFLCLSILSNVVFWCIIGFMKKEILTLSHGKRQAIRRTTENQ